MLPPAGLLDLQRAQEWVVTTKLGSSDKRPGTGGDGSAITIPSCRLYLNELAWALFTAAAGFYGLFAGTAHMGLALYLLVQSERGAGGGAGGAAWGWEGAGPGGAAPLAPPPLISAPAWPSSQPPRWARLPPSGT